MLQLALNGEDGVARTWKQKSPEFKKQAVKRMQKAKNIGRLAEELGVSRAALYRWKYIEQGRLKPR